MILDQDEESNFQTDIVINETTDLTRITEHADDYDGVRNAVKVSIAAQDEGEIIA